MTIDEAARAAAEESSGRRTAAAIIARHMTTLVAERDARIAELERESEIVAGVQKTICNVHEAGFREAYKMLGIEDDGEYRWKWLLLKLADFTDPKYQYAGSRIQRGAIECRNKEIEELRTRAEAAESRAAAAEMENESIKQSIADSGLAPLKPTESVRVRYKDAGKLKPMEEPQSDYEMPQAQP